MKMDDIVISGISGRFPESDNIDELIQNLYDGVDLITEDDVRWPQGLYGLPKGLGKIKNLPQFDAEFFGISGRQAHVMDPQVRMLLEVTYEALVDAGVNFKEFCGTNTGVFVASALSDAKEILSSDPTKIQGYEILGSLASFYANRVSHSFDFKGPSTTLENGCASSFTAVVHGIQAIRAGHCDAAIICGVNLILSPNNSLCWQRLNCLSPDSRCRTFSSSANGYVRSDGVVALLVQKRPDARRVYGTIRGARNNVDGYTPEGLTFPSETMQCRLHNDTLKEAKLKPSDISYFEAHGTATQVGDAQELAAIIESYCKQRNTPLKIGSIKTNIGHTEATAGLCSIVKVILSMETGVIPGNLHYDSPNTSISALLDGRLKVIDRNTSWEGGFAALNCFGMGGSNGHIIIESNSKTRSPVTRYNIPRLIVASGRTRASVKKLLELGNNYRENAELHALLDAVHAKHVSGLNHRGFAITGEPYLEELAIVDNTKCRPIWFMFTSVGSEWDGLSYLMRLPLFKSSIKSSIEALRPFGIDLMNIFERDHATLDILGSIAIQIALADVLHGLEIQAKGILGYCSGEIGCAYAKGILSAEQAIKCGYWCRKSIEEPNMILEIKENLEKCLENITDNDKKCIAEQLLNSMLARTCENENWSEIPEQAIIVEVGSSSDLTNAILNNKPSAVHLTLLNDNVESSPWTHLLSVIGRLFNAGAQPQIKSLYPPIQWPVSRGTPGISSHVVWDHSKSWKVPHYTDFSYGNENCIAVDLAHPRYSYLSGYKIDGKIMFPPSGLMELVWDIYLRGNGGIEKTAIEFKDVTFVTPVVLSHGKETQFIVTVLPITGKFEVCIKDTVVATGIIQRTRKYESEKEKPEESATLNSETGQSLNTAYIYYEFNKKGYCYDGFFKGIQTFNTALNSGSLSWHNNWAAFIDTMFQADLLASDVQGIYLPTAIKKVTINRNICDINKDIPVNLHNGIIIAGGIQIEGLQWSQQSLDLKIPQLTKLQKYVFCPYDNSNNTNEHVKSLRDALTISLQIILENSDGSLNIKEIPDAENELLLTPCIKDILDSEQQARFNISVVNNLSNQTYMGNVVKYTVEVPQDASLILENDCNLLVVSNMLNRLDDKIEIKKYLTALQGSGMILLMESCDEKDLSLHRSLSELRLEIISRQVFNENQLILLRRQSIIAKEYAVVEIRNDNYFWLDELKTALKSHERKQSRIYLVSYDNESGLLGLFTSLRQEVGDHQIRCYFLPGVLKRFDVNEPFYADALKKDLNINILKNGMWGCYRYLLLDDFDIALELKHSVIPVNTSSSKGKSKKEYGVCTSQKTGKVSMHPEKSYIFVGGLGELGLQLAQWLVSRGATKLVLNSRCGITTENQSNCIERLKKLGVDVLVATDNCVRIAGGKALLEKAINLGPIGGIFHLAVVLRDATLENQTAENFKIVGEAKIEVTKVLDDLSKTMAPDLDFFVTYSSIVCGQGFYGHTNYGFANSIMERIVENRRNRSLPGLAIQWGPIAEVGITARSAVDIEELVSKMSGLELQTVESHLEVLDIILTQPHPVVSCCVVMKKSDQIKKDIPNLCHQVAKIFGISDVNTVSPNLSFVELGMDSIMASEIKNTLKMDYNILMNMKNIQNLTFRKLEELG